MTRCPRCGVDAERVVALLEQAAAELRGRTAPVEPLVEQGLSTAEAAERFERSERQIRRLCKMGAGQRIGAGWVVDPVRLRTMLGR